MKGSFEGARVSYRITPVFGVSIPPNNPHKTSLPFTILLSKQSHILGYVFPPLGLPLRIAIGNLVPFEGTV
jgi:hypothetical protein